MYQHQNISVIMGRPKNPLNTLHKICPTCQKPFACERRKEKTFCCKTCASNSPEVKQKNREGVEATFQKKYGGFPITVDPAVKRKMKTTVLGKYGVDWISKSEGFNAKGKQTKLEKYGDANFNNVEKMKETCLERFGVENYVQTSAYKDKVKATSLIRYGVDHSSKSKDFKDSHKALMFKKFLESSRFSNFEPQFSFEEYQGVTPKFNKKYVFKCKRCLGIEEQYIADGKSPHCSTCDKKSMSDFQSEVVEFIKTLCPDEVVSSNDRSVLYPLELDIYIPSKELAIETDGLYYHSEVAGSKDKNYHLNKTKKCIAHRVRLIHVFEQEWNHKKEIVKSILRSTLAKINTKLYARDCSIREVDSRIEKTSFLSENHIQGNDHSTIKLGLYHGDKLVSMMTFVKSRFDRKVEWEMSRVCSKRGYTIVGGSSKLFSHFVKTHKPKSVVSYSDRRYFSGETYLKLGFNFVENTRPNYHYIIDNYDTVESRINWQKAKLDKKLLLFDGKLSEWENMKANGFDRIWDCGHSKWIWIDKTLKINKAIHHAKT